MEFFLNFIYKTNISAYNLKLINVHITDFIDQQISQFLHMCQSMRLWYIFEPRHVISNNVAF